MQVSTARAITVDSALDGLLREVSGGARNGLGKTVRGSTTTNPTTSTSRTNGELGSCRILSSGPPDALSSMLDKFASQHAVHSESIRRAPPPCSDILAAVRPKPRRRRASGESGAIEHLDVDSLLATVEGAVESGGGQWVASEGALEPPLVRQPAPTKRRCIVTCLGGTDCKKGLTLSSSAIRGGGGCDRLRCTACDFSVLRFDASAWCDSEVNYLFFRNNMPDRGKLSAQLLPSPRSCAYACQCSWISTTACIRLGLPGSSTANLRWVCSGHES
jgi:hypothetical protein